MDDDEFRRGAIDIQWLERRLPEILSRKPSDEATRIAAIAAALLAERDRSARSVNVEAGTSASEPREMRLDSWKQAARIEGLRS
jgi:hypothetical protein